MSAPTRATCGSGRSSRCLVTEMALVQHPSQQCQRGQAGIEW
ncbi:hypothetical protein [Tessaracoccus sp. MC1679]|nr:hypothetical protein [Tessaracoccus sp. MC1679]